MGRTVSLVSLLLAIGLLVVGCGDGDTSQVGPESHTDDLAATGASDVDPPIATVRDSAERPAPPDGNPEPQPVNREPAPVRLGDRFEWCGDIQREWDRQAQVQAQVDAELAAWRDVEQDYEAATDELDKAEALTLTESAELRYRDLLPVLVAANDAAVRPVRASSQGVDATQVIALERAREALSASADQALLELMEIAYPTSPHTEPAAAEPSAGDQPWPVTPHGGVVSQHPQADDEAMTLEASLAQLATLQDEVVSWSAAYWSAIQQMESALLDIDESKSPIEAIAAHERLLEAAPMPEQTQAVGWNASDAAERLRRAYVLSARQALQADTMSPEEYRSGLVDVEATVRAILERIQQVRASDDAVRLIHAGAVTLEEAANGFVLADTAAWTAFRASLSESCKPKP